MGRWLLTTALIFVAAVGIAPAAVETTTVQGKVLTPDGQPATGGTITCILSQPGSTDDTSTGQSQRVASRTTCAIGADGSVSCPLVPNDAITPAGTYYDVRISVTGPTRATWTERWQIDTTPDPVDIGDVTRLNIAPGITVGDYMEYVDTAPSGSCHSGESPKYVTSTGEHCVCDSGSWSCTSGGGGSGDMSKSTYDTDSDSTVDAAEGLASISAWSVRYEDRDTDGDGTPDLRICGDYDGDGVLEGEDIQQCMDTFCDADGDDTEDRSYQRDLDGDGTWETIRYCGTVMLLPGTWRLDGATFADKRTIKQKWSGLTVAGFGPDETILKTALDIDDIRGQGSTNIWAHWQLGRLSGRDVLRSTLRDLTIVGIDGVVKEYNDTGATDIADWDNDGISDAGDHGVMIARCPGCLIENVHVVSCARQGFNVDSAIPDDDTPPTIRHVSTEGQIGEHCVEMYRPANVFESLFYGCENRYGVAFWPGGTMTVDGPIIRDNIIGRTRTCIKLYSSPSASSVVIRNAQVTRNTCTEPGIDGIAIMPDNNTSYVHPLVDSNILLTSPVTNYTAGVRGMIVIGRNGSGETRSPRVVGNHVLVDEHTSAGDFAGINLAAVAGMATITGNAIDVVADATVYNGGGSEPSGVRVGGQAVVAGNHIVIDVGDDAKAWGIYVSSAADGAIISQNVIALNDIDGDGTAKPTVQYVAGVRVAGASDVVVAGNTVMSQVGQAKLYGVFWGNTTSNTLMANNRVIDGQAIATDGGSVVTDAVLLGNVGMRLSGFPIYQNNASSTIAEVGSTCFDCAMGSYYGDPDITHGYTAILDANSDGAIDAESVLRILEDGYVSSRAILYRPGAAPATCDASHKGEVYFDSALSELCFCDGSSWQQVDGGGGC